MMLLHWLLVFLAAAGAESFLFGGGSGGGCGCKPSCPAPPPCPPPPPPRPCTCACPRITPPAPCGCGVQKPGYTIAGCGASAAVAASSSYATYPSNSYSTGGNLARDDNITTFAGSYGGNDSGEDGEGSKHREMLPELTVPDKYTTYEEFASFLSQANNEDFSTLDRPPSGISASTALRRSAGFRRHREAEKRRRRQERRRTETPRCPNRRLRNMINEAIWDDGPSAAKYRLLRAAKNLRTSFNIVCSESDFSYFIDNDNFCEYRTRGVVCLMFEQ